MAREQVRREGSRKRERLTTLLLALFPLLVATGFFAPGFVRLLALAQETEPEDRQVVVDRVGPFGHRPRVIPRDFSAGFVPELLDLDQLFMTATFRPDPPSTGIEVEQFARVSAFDRSYGDSITQDTPGQQIMEIVFKDVLMDYKTPVDMLISSVDPIGTNLGLCGTLHSGNCVRDDDMVSDELHFANPVPEPGTAMLMGLGLLGIAVAGRRR